MYKVRIMVLPTLKFYINKGFYEDKLNVCISTLKQILIILMLLLSIPISGQTLEEKLEELCINMSRLTDMSDLNDIVIPEPNLAIINITGTKKMPTKKNSDTHAWFELYDGNGNYFKKPVILNAQGKSSMNFTKKNFAVDFYKDDYMEAVNVTIGNWVKQDSYHFKAYYIDYFRGVSAIGYKLYDQISADRGRIWSRASLDNPNEKARCYPDGFPALVCLNGKFYGVFSWQLKKNRKNYSLTKNIAEHIHLDGVLRNDSIWNGTVKWGAFEVRNPKTLYTMDGEKYDGDHPMELIDETSSFYNLETDKEEIKANKQITAQVKHYIEELSSIRPKLLEKEKCGATKKEMRKEIELLFDVPGLIDYCCFHFIVDNCDGFGKNWQWFTYDGKKWYVAPYDLDYTFGNFYKGTILFPAEWNRHTSDYKDLPTVGPMYFIKKYYLNEIKARYAELRDNGVISPENIKSIVKNWYYRIGEENYALEYKKWKDSKCISETICNEGWTTSDDWTNYKVTPDYNSTNNYQVGDKCRLDCRIFTATSDIIGVNPYKQLGYSDSLARLCRWIEKRIELEDAYLGYKAPDVPMSSYSLYISSWQWATVCVPFSFIIPEKLKVYTIVGQNYDNGILQLEQVYTTEANKPYLISGPTGFYHLTGYADDTENNTEEYLVNHLLHGTYTTIFAPNESYVLQSYNGEVGFRLVRNKNVPVCDNSAYMITNSIKHDFIPINQNLDNLRPIINNCQQKAYAVYDITGKKLRQVKRGVNILKYSNGEVKKVIK